MASAAYLRKSRSDDPNEPLEETLSRHKLQLQAAAHRYSAFHILEELHHLGTQIQAVSGHDLLIISDNRKPILYDLNDDLDEELTEFKTFLSRREYKMITKRLHRGILQTVKEGGHVSSIPDASHPQQSSRPPVD